MAIDALFDFIMKFRKKKEYKKGIERFLNQKKPFYLIETEILASGGKKISLLNFLINKELVFLNNNITLGLRIIHIHVDKVKGEGVSRDPETCL